MIEVKIGSTVVTENTKAASGVGANYTYVHDHPSDPPEEDSESLPVTIKTWDAVGNELLVNPETIQFDYVAPDLSGIAYLERCDGYTRARVDSDTVYVKHDSYGCNFDATPGASCSGGATGPVRITFNANEALNPDYTRVYVNLTTPIEWSEADCGESSNVYATFSPAGSETEGNWNIRADFEDLAGNRTDYKKVGSLRVDYSAPSAPDVSSQTDITYTRIPWGSDDANSAYDSAGNKHFAVRGLDGAVEDEALVTVYDAESVSGASTLGTAIADGDGAFGAAVGSNGELTLNAADRAHVYLTATDKAGNESDASADAGTQASLVRNVIWVATPGFKQAGSLLENPHVFETARWFQNSLTQNGADEMDSGDGITANDSDYQRTDGAHIAWANIGPHTDYPGSRQGAAMVYDSARGRVVLYGGLRGSQYLDDTWEWDGVRWHQIFPADPEEDGNPDAREGHAMAYLTDRERTLVAFGSGASELYLSDHWEWDGTSWRELAIADPEGDGNPSSRYGPAMSYNTLESELILTGGQGVTPESWLGRIGTDERPGHVARFNFWATGNCEMPDISEVAVDYYSGGRGWGYAFNYGVQLKVWDQGRWNDVDYSTAGDVTSPQHLEWSTTDQQTIDRLLFGDYQTINFAVAPRRHNSTNQARVSTDYVELVVKYRIAANADAACD